MTRIAREQLLLKTFALKVKRARYAELLGSAKEREKVCKSLDHFKDLDLARCELIRPENQNPDRINRLLRNLGAPAACYVFSSNPLIDGRELSLEEALREVVGYGFGSFVCCIPGRLAYFETEDPGERYLCAAAEQA